MTITGSEKTLAVTPVDSEPTVAIGQLSDPDAELEVLDAASRYAFHSTLGEGGMGEVRLVRDRQIGRDIALKSMLDKVEARADLKARFVREARVQAQLEHPSIVPVYEIARDPASGRAFFTMRRIDGVTLADVIDRLRAGDEAIGEEYTRHRLLGAFTRVCLALDYAHARGVVHRDMKPSNVMLGGFGEVYVLDWGLAKVKGAAHSASERRSVPEPIELVGSGASGQTEAGSLLGTPGYMAPEQIRGESGTIDARTDVYALGAILFELLTLEPLQGEGGPAQLMKRALEGAEARASVRTPHKDVAPELEAICVRATSLAPRDRFGSARELADAVDAFLSGDRDHELRRAIAGAQLERAREASRAVGSGAIAERREALREVGRAIALAPDDRDGIELLVGLLTSPPAEVPDEVRAALEASEVRPQRKLLPRAAIGILCVWLLLGPLGLWAGVRDATLFATVIGAWVLAAGAMLYVWRYDLHYAVKTPYLAITLAVAVAATSLLFGPFLLVPAVALAVVTAYTLTTRRDYRLFVISWGVVGMLAPVALAAAGLHPAAVTFDGDTMTVHAAALRLFPVPTYTFLSFMQLLALGMGVFFVASYRDVVHAAETRAQLMSWQLRQLVPAEALTRPPRA